MLDLSFIRAHPDKIRKAAQDKGVEIDLDRILELDKKRRDLIGTVDDLRARRNEISEAYKNEPDDELIQEGRELKDRLQEQEPALKEVQEELDGLLARVPNIPLDEVPVGPDETGNEEVRRWGEPREFSFEPLDHIRLGEKLDVLDLERGAKVSGFRGYFLKNEAALMELGVMVYSLRKLQAKGFTPFIPPVLVRKFTLFGTGWLPWGADQNYRLEDTDKYLAATAEVPVTAYHADEILNESELPKKYVAFSPCFRSEAGSHGKDVKGLYRLHQFNKVEQVIVCKNDLGESRKWHEVLLENAEEILRDLELPYRVLLMCTGDMGEPQMKKYDIETWMPGRGDYGETQSDSIMGDFQARRLNIRYRDADGEIRVAHTLNNTAIASPRILVAILENYQQEDGSVRVPEVLQPYVGTATISPRD